MPDRSTAPPEKSPETAGPDPMAAPSLSLPKGGGAIRGIGEKFGANPVTGTGSLSVPIAASPGRSGFGPQLALAYDSGAGNGPFGLGWRLSASAITRKTDKGLPLYEDDREEDSDVFLMSDAEDLVPVLLECDGEWVRDAFEATCGGATFRVQRYRPRVEGAFARMERWRDAATGTTHWRTISRDNLFSVFGDSPDSRIADPDNPSRVFSWLLARSWDDRGNLAVYEYKAEDREGVPDALPERHRSVAANRYCKRILYGNAQPYDPGDPVLPCDWHFQLVVRIRNGEVCYWPNQGYGHFGVKITMDSSPVFDYADQFDPRRVRLADVDGSGATDIVYLGADGIQIYFNLSGNAWSAVRRLPQFPVTSRLDEVTVVDLLGNGTACLVWSSPLPGEARSPLRYVDLMGGTKPYLLTTLRNNLGAETRVHYAPSTRFYLADCAAGTPWITRLPFPVHVVERVEVFDRISGNRFVTRYAYHHGYFDGVEREFRGFGMVEQWDTEEFSTLAGGHEDGASNWDAASDVPPMLTRTWFHTGFFVARDRVSRQFEREYFRDPEDGYLLADTVLPAGLSTWEEREACRALKGAILARRSMRSMARKQQADRTAFLSATTLCASCSLAAATCTRCSSRMPARRSILAAERRRYIALRELNNHQRQIEHAIEVQDFLRDKLTNQELYLFLQQETAALYRQTYELARHVAAEAQRAFNYERGHTARTFLPSGACPAPACASSTSATTSPKPGTGSIARPASIIKNRVSCRFVSAATVSPSFPAIGR